MATPAPAPAPAQGGRELLLRGAAAKRGDTDEAKLLRRTTHMHLNALSLTALTSFAACPKLEVLYAYDNHLTDANHLETAPNLQYLYLQQNRLASLQHISNLPHLRKLYLDKNYISSLAGGLTNCPALEELHLSDQRIFPGNSLHLHPPTLHALARSLRTLSLAGCNLSDDEASALAALHSLRKLDISRNALESPDALEHVLSALQQLTSLDLRHNPICKMPRYRETVTLMNDSVRMLDNEEVTDTHRQFLLRLNIQRLHKQVRAGGPAGGLAGGGGVPPLRAPPQAKGYGVGGAGAVPQPDLLMAGRNVAWET